jgi:hypothetical protein
MCWRAGPEAAVDHQAAADAGAHDDAEDEAAPLPGPVPRLGQREAVGVVLDPQRLAQAAREIGGQIPAVEARGVGFFIRPVRLEMAPGVPMPMLPRVGMGWRAAASTSAATVSTMWS